MAIYVKTPEGVFVTKSQTGDVPITDPVTLRDLAGGRLPYTAATGGTADVSTANAGGDTPVPVPQPTGNGTPSPYTIFNKNLASILSDIQSKQSAGAANLGGGINAMTNTSVAPNGPAPADPGVFSGSTVAGQETLEKSFSPAITSLNTQLQNTNAGLSLLSGNIKDLAQIYAPQAVAPGMSLVTPDGKVIKQGHAYTPTINTLTGLMDGFDTSTGTWASQDSGGGSGHISTPVPNSSGGQTVVGGVDFGTTTTGIKPYGGADPNGYASDVNTMYNSLKTAMPLPTSAGLDEFIKAHVKSSPITGQMIFNGASQYQLDPNLLAAVLGHESDFGTAGMGAKTNNPGNVSNNSDTGASKTYSSWQQGVNAAAAELARRKVTTQTPVTDTKAETPVGGTFSTAAKAKVSQLPQYMQDYVDAGPKGVAYINDDRVPANSKDSVKTIAARAGIPYVQASDASALKSISVVYKSLDQMQALANKNLSSGAAGHAKDTVLGGAAQFLQTDWGNDLSLFNSYRDTAIKAVQALAGGAGSGLRINGAEIMANMSNLAGAGDSKEHATKLITQMKTLLDNQLQATFPYIGSDGSGGGAQEGTTHSYNGINYVVKNGVWTPQ